MEIYHLPRGGGKTTALIRKSARTQIPIVVPYAAMLDLVKEKAKDMGLSIPDPILYSKVDPNVTPKVYVDEAGYVLKRLLGVDVVGLSIGEDTQKKT